MLLAMAQDIRVVLIKLADRLHNMRTLYGLPSEKQQRIARQTMEIYAPLAERLGIWQIKWELEDLAFKALEPERFRELAKLLDTRRKGRETLHRAGDRGAQAAARGRPASRPTSRAARSTSTASGRRCSARARSSARSTTSTPSACSSRRSATATRRSASSTRSGGRSRASSTTTSRSPRTTSTSRSTPRSSRSTASRSRSRSGPTQMHQVSEVGIAAHWRYKEGTKSDREYDAKLAWLRQLMDWQRDVSRRDRVRRGHQARHLPGPGLRVHAEGRHQGPAGRRDAARLRLPDPHRRRPSDDRGQGQQPARAARLPAQERRHRRDRHDQGRARAVARLDERRPHQPRPREDPPMVQAQGPRREHRPRPRVARARAAPPGPDVDRGGRRRTGSPRSRSHYNYETLDDFYAAIGYGAVGAQTVVMRLGVVDDGQSDAADGRPAAAARRGPAASGSRASATCSSASPSAATRSRATRSSASSPAARA